MIWTLSDLKVRYGRRSFMRYDDARAHATMINASGIDGGYTSFVIPIPHKCIFTIGVRKDGETIPLYIGQIDEPIILIMDGE